MEAIMKQNNYPDRRQFIGGSDARIIMGGDEASLVRLWREKRGEVPFEDLSDNLAVQLGSVTEDLNRRWFERNSGQVVRDVQRHIQHPVIGWMAATLDGIVEGTGAIFEAKFALPWSFSEEAAAEKHMAQLQHNMWVANANPRSCRSSPAEENGSNSPFTQTRYTNICCSLRRKSFGDALGMERYRTCSAWSPLARDSKPSASSI